MWIPLIWSDTQNLPSLVSSGHTTYVKGRLIGETDRLISDIIEVCKLPPENGRSNFSHVCSQKICFGENFVTWIENVTKNQESYVLGSGKTT